MQLCGNLSILWHCLSLELEWKLTFSCPVATAEFSKFAGILSAALSQHHLSVSYLFAFSYCSWDFRGKNTETVNHSLLQWTTFCQTSPPWPVCLGWPYTAWLSFIKKRESSRKTSTSALLTMPKPLTVWITTICGKFFKRWEYQATLPTSCKIFMQVKKQQLELHIEQQTVSKSGKKYIKAGCCHPAYLTYM